MASRLVARSEYNSSLGSLVNKTLSLSLCSQICEISKSKKKYIFKQTLFNKYNQYLICELKVEGFQWHTRVVSLTAAGAPPATNDVTRCWTSPFT